MVAEAAAATTAAFALPTNVGPLISSPPAAACAAATVTTAASAALCVPAGLLWGALTQRVALQKSIPPLSSLPAAAYGATIRSAAGYAAIRVLYVGSGMGAAEVALAAAAATTTAVSERLLSSIVAFIVMTTCFATGARLGSILQPVGITGGIACGKSTVSELLQKEEGKGPSCAIIDVDKIGHDILIPGKLPPGESAYENVVREFGMDILSKKSATEADKDSDDGGDDRPRIERRKLGDVIFKNPSKRRTLNGLTHPLISKIMLKRIVTWNLFPRAHQTMNKLVAVDIPLLFEVGLKMKILFGLKVVVACQPSTQLKRLMERNKDLTKEQCQNRIDSQMPISDKVKMGDVVIWNDGDWDELKAEVAKARGEIAGRVRGWGVTVPRVMMVLAASFVAKAVSAASGL